MFALFDSTVTPQSPLAPLPIGQLEFGKDFS